MKKAVFASLVFAVAGVGAGCGLLPSGDPAADENLEIAVCSLRSCPLQMLACLLDPACRETLVCNAGCGAGGAESEQQACHLFCQLSRGERSEIYRALIQCFADNGCLPTLPEGTDGQCLVTDENIQDVHGLGSLDEIEGTWREVRGLNCGVPGSGWEGGYDALPCRASSWVFHEQQWWYHTSFCAPSEDGGCGETGAAHLIAEPELSETEPGLLEVHYVNPALQPQEERWYVLSRPDPDWVMYTYCGSTPGGAYAGVNVMTRVPAPSYEVMPVEVEAAFRQAAWEFGFSYEDMCVTEQSGCPTVTAEADVREWVAGL